MLLLQGMLFPFVIGLVRASCSFRANSTVVSQFAFAINSVQPVVTTKMEDLLGQVTLGRKHCAI